MSEQLIQDAPWSEFLAAERRFSAARARLLSAQTTLHDVLDPALRDPTQRRTALRLLQTLDESTRREYFPTLVRLACVGHTDIALVRDLILSLDRQWVTANIWGWIEEVLNGDATDEEYRRYAELLRAVAPTLLGGLVELALSSDDEDVREVGEDFRPFAVP